MILALALACATISITDGDTFVCADGAVVRLQGMDTPEMDGRCPSERLLAIRARTRLGELLRGEVRLTGDRRDRYGRLLREVWVGRRNIGQQMILEDMLALIGEGERRGAERVAAVGKLMHDAPMRRVAGSLEFYALCVLIGVGMVLSLASLVL